MKKLIITLFSLIAVVSCFMAFPAAAEAAPVNNFKITSGIDTSKSLEITFDSNKVISGTAEPGAQIAINIFEPVAVNGSTSYRLIRNYNILVGSTGIYSQNVALKEGSNYMVVAARKDVRSSEVRTTIVRKKKVLKTTLSQSIAVPGRSSW